MKRIGSFLLSVVLCTLLACGGADVTTPIGSSSETSVTSGTTRGTIRFTAGSTRLSARPPVPGFVEREEWHVEVVITDISGGKIFYEVRDLDNLGYWCVLSAHDLEKKNEDGTWTKIISSNTNSLTDIWAKVVYVNPKPVESGLVTGQGLLYTSNLEYFGYTTVPEGTYRFTKAIYKDSGRTHRYDAQLEFTIPLS